MFTSNGIQIPKHFPQAFSPYMGVGGLGGFRPPQNPKYPTQTRCLGKILTKNVFLRPF